MSFFAAASAPTGLGAAADDEPADAVVCSSSAVSTSAPRLYVACAFTCSRMAANSGVPSHAPQHLSRRLYRKCDHLCCSTWSALIAPDAAAAAAAAAAFFFP